MSTQKDNVKKKRVGNLKLGITTQMDINIRYIYFYFLRAISSIVDRMG